MKLKNFLIGSATLLTLCSSVFADIDEPMFRLGTRHIYNNSNTTWKIQFSNTSPHSAHVDVKGAGCTHSNTPCIIPPKSAFAMEFNGTPSTYDNHSGTITIEDPTNVSHTFSYHTEGRVSKYVRIDHAGKTGSVTLNSPANGDIVIEQDKW